jgi:hypothetical protein
MPACLVAYIATNYVFLLLFATVTVIPNVQSYLRNRYSLSPISFHFSIISPPPEILDCLSTIRIRGIVVDPWRNLRRLT